jgi:tetratricopeptide (TPR) repeat protein
MGGSHTTIFAQDQAEFERTWYDTCYTKKDNDKCYQQSKELVDKYGSSQYAENAKKNIKNYEYNKSLEKFNTELKAFYTPPQDGTKLEKLFSAGEEFIKIEPDQQNPYYLFVVGQIALAGRIPAMTQNYKNLDRVKIYSEQAITAFDKATAAPEKYKKEYSDYVDPIRDQVKANLNQYLGYYINETKGDPEQALAYLTKATQVRSKDGTGWKDPFTYFLRANIYSKQYEQLRAKYDALSDDQKTGDTGKDLLKEVNQLLDAKLIPEHARVIATATTPETKSYKDAASELFNAFWKFRTDAPEKAPAYIKSFEADPTVAGPPVPVKSDTSSTDLSAPAAPITTASTGAKLATGATTAAPGSTKATTNGSSKSKTRSGKRGRKG